MADQEENYEHYPENGYYAYFSLEAFTFLVKEYVKRNYEADYLDFKKEKIKPDKLASIIGAMANTQSGMMVFGIDPAAEEPWLGVSPSDMDELSNQVSQVQRDSLTPTTLELKTEQLQIDSKMYGLLFVPKVKEEVLTKGKYYYRRDRITDYAKSANEREVWLAKKRQLDKFGFLIFEHLQADLTRFYEERKRSSPKFKAFSFIQELIEQIKRTEETIITLPEQWKLIFRPWELEWSIKTKQRIWLAQWRPQRPTPEIVELITQIEQIVTVLSTPPFEKKVSDPVIALLKDMSYREGDKTNHRRCLHTYLLQGNPWNFTDWRYFIEPMAEGGLRLYYEEGRAQKVGSPRQKTVKIYPPGNIPTRNEIEDEIRGWVLQGYQEFVKDLVANIIIHLETLLKEIEPTLPK